MHVQLSVIQLTCTVHHVLVEQILFMPASHEHMINKQAVQSPTLLCLLCFHQLSLIPVDSTGKTNMPRKETLQYSKEK